MKLNLFMLITQESLMAFYQITYNKKYDFATLHNWGCTFRCPFCSYKLRGGADSKPGFMTPKPASFLTTEEIKTVLAGQRPKTVSLMGGEPSLAPDLEELLAFAKQELGAKTKLGHTNGTRIPTENLDYANVGFKAWSRDLHYRITGKPKDLIYTNFKNAWESGMQMEANLVYIPGFVGLDELEGLCGFLAELDDTIPLRISGYIPVPGQPWKRPTKKQMAEAKETAEKYLKTVEASHLTVAEALDLSMRDDRFDVEVLI